MLIKQFKEIAHYAILRGSILAVMAIVTFINPIFLKIGMVYAIAAYAILNGILGIMCFMENKVSEKKAALYFYLLASNMSILFGILCTIYFRYIVGILPVFLGGVLIMESVVHFIAALGVRGSLKPLIIILSILAAIGGIVLMIFTFGFGGIHTLSQMFGSLLVLSCIEELLIHLSNQPTLKRQEGANK